MVNWLTHEIDQESADVRRINERRLAEAERNRQARAAEERASYAKYMADLDRLEAESAPADAKALAAARAEVDRRNAALAEISEELARQRADLALVENAAAVSLVDASLADLRRAASGKSAAAAPEIQARRAVVDELERREQAASEAVAVAQREVATVRTAGLRNKQIELCAQLIDVMEQAAALFDDVLGLQARIQYYGGPMSNPLPNAGRMRGEVKTFVALTHRANDGWKN